MHIFLLNVILTYKVPIFYFFILYMNVFYCWLKRLNLETVVEEIERKWNSQINDILFCLLFRWVMVTLTIIVGNGQRT